MSCQKIALHAPIVRKPDGSINKRICEPTEIQRCTREDGHDGPCTLGEREPFTHRPDFSHKPEK